MAWINIKEKVESFIKKYRYVLLIVFLGLVLMNLPKKEDTETSIIKQENNTTTVNSATEEQRMEDILRKISGVGEVEVMLTLACGQQTVYQTDTDSSSNSDSASKREQTVIVTDGNRENSGLIMRIDAPKYLGAVIVCKGGDDPIVRLAVVDAVSKALGLGTDKISVLKMN